MRNIQNKFLGRWAEAAGKAFFKATCDLGLEGIVAKEKSSPYVPGQRGPA